MEHTAGILLSDIQMEREESQLESFMCSTLTKETSIFTAELVAIIKTLDWIIDNKPTEKPINILTDSLSAAQAIENNSLDSRPDLINEIQYKLYEIRQHKLNITITWIPAHVGISGNEKADKLAKSACSK